MCQQQFYVKLYLTLHCFNVISSKEVLILNFDSYSIVKEYRVKKGLSQNDLAKKVGLSQQAIALIENGKRKLEADLFIKILQALNLSEEESKDILNRTLANIISDTYTVTAKNGNLLVDLSDEAKLIDNYKILNNLGKNEAIKRVEELTEIPKYTMPDNELNAAHSLRISNPTDQKHDDSIMNNDDEWT